MAVIADNYTASILVPGHNIFVEHSQLVSLLAAISGSKVANQRGNVVGVTRNYA